MAFSEIDSFVEKFKHLWHAGIKASLNVESFDGEACVTLQAGLGNIPPPYRFQSYHPRPPRGPAYERRQEKRKAARQAPAAVRESLPEASNDNNASNTTDQVVNDDEESDTLRHEAALAAEAIDNNEIIVISKKAEEAPENLSISENGKIEAERAPFVCELCDFVSNWKNGLNIHLSRKHGDIEQLDGHNDSSFSDEKYYNSRHYWEKGRLGTVYQTYLDANEIIDKSDLSEDDKFIEKKKLLNARKSALGQNKHNFKNFPPWNIPTDKRRA